MSDYQVEFGLDYVHADGQLAVCTLEAALVEMGSCLRCLAGFWNSGAAKNVGEDDVEALRSSIHSVSVSMDGLVPGVQRSTLPRRLQKWLR